MPQDNWESVERPGREPCTYPPWLRKGGVCLSRCVDPSDDYRMSTAPDGSSFVTHWVVVHKPLMLELLDALTRSNDGRGDDGLGVLPAAPAWARRILSSVRREHLMQVKRQTGGMGLGEGLRDTMRLAGQPRQ